MIQLIETALTILQWAVTTVMVLGVTVLALGAWSVYVVFLKRDETENIV